MYIYERLKKFYGEERIEAHNIRSWVNKFKVGETSLEDKGKWNTSDSYNRNTVNDLIRADWFITVTVMFLEPSFSSYAVQTMIKQWDIERCVQKSSQLTVDLK